MQQKAAQLTVENLRKRKKLSKGEIIASAGYSDAMKQTPAQVFDTKGFKEELAKLGFDSNNAKQVVAEILNKKSAMNKDRLRAASLVFEVQGDFAPEKTISVNFDADSTALRDIIASMKGKNDL